jgi:NAD(P)-dependent dehydrogenase (short-subunit alcohol dehydrogenase family)
MSITRKREETMSTDKFALITGGGLGIGKASALALARAGWHVALAGRRLDPIAAAAREIEALGRRSFAHSCDVGDPDAVAALFAAVENEFGRLDLLFNNAGTNTPGVPMEELTYAQWKTVVDANLTGAFLCAQGAIRLMKKQSPRGGRIINNGSISAHAPRPNSAPYTATKHAITGLTKSIALDCRQFDIACGQIDIGNALTEMAFRMTTGVPQADGRIAIEPTIDANEVGEAILHMASLPLSTNILTMTIMATKMPFVGRG